MLFQKADVSKSLLGNYPLWLIWVISYGRTDCIIVSESVQICRGRVRVPGPFLPTTPLTFVQRLGVP